MYDHSVVKNKTVLSAATENFTINWLPVFGLEIAIFMREIFLSVRNFFVLVKLMQTLSQWYNLKLSTVIFYTHKIKKKEGLLLSNFALMPGNMPMIDLTFSVRYI